MTARRRHNARGHILSGRHFPGHDADRDGRRKRGDGGAARRRVILRVLAGGPADAVAIAAACGVTDLNYARRLAGLLVDEGLAAVTRAGGRMAFELTDYGRAALSEEMGRAREPSLAMPRLAEPRA